MRNRVLIPYEWYLRPADDIYCTMARICAPRLMEPAKRRTGAL